MLFEEVDSDIIKKAKKYNRVVLSSKCSTTRFINRLSNYLDNKLAPHVTMHGVLVDVYGIGVLIKGESSIGKSETALELIQKGHRLVADDAVEIRKVDDSRLVGQAPELLKHYMEIRGIGIIDNLLINLVVLHLLLNTTLLYFLAFSIMSESTSKSLVTINTGIS